MNVVHIITDLNDGGAEAVLYRLCLADEQNTRVVITLQDEGKYGPLLEMADITVYCLGMQRGKITLKGVLKLAQLLRELRPDVVQTWMYHADLIGGVVARAVGIRHIFWGVHNTTLEKGKAKRTTIMVARINALLSRWIPKGIVSCSHKGVVVHQALGYASEKFRVIPNGYDLRYFSPDIQSGVALKSIIAVPDGISLLGTVARFDSEKDHLNLITALGLLKQSSHDFRCILVGKGMTKKNSVLTTWLDLHHVSDRVFLLGQRSDIPAVMNALDVHVLSSSSEAFPNVLCEAMACGTPCITTDVGDAALIVGDIGWVVPAYSAQQLSQAMTEAIEQKSSDLAGWKRRKLRATQRIYNNFSIENMADSYRSIWDESISVL